MTVLETGSLAIGRESPPALLQVWLQVWYSQNVVNICNKGTP